MLKRNAIRKFTIIEIEKAEIEGKFIGKEAIENDWLVDFEFGVPTGTQVSHFVVYTTVNRIHKSVISFQTIPAISIDVWRKKIDELEHDIKQFLYPPCFCVVALPKTNNPAFTQLCFETSEGSIVHLKLSLSSESVMLVPRSNSQGKPVASYTCSQLPIIHAVTTGWYNSKGYMFGCNYILI